MDKYYTPEIEEFHIGFEYEMVPSIGLTIFNFDKPDEKCETKWATEYQKGIYGVKEIGFFGGLPDIVAAIKNNKCRVKYLDREDIESFGFKESYESDDSEFIFESDLYTGISNGNDYIFIILHDPKSKITRVYRMHNNGFEEDYFKGIIKNKAELGKLLKQLK